MSDIFICINCGRRESDFFGLLLSGFHFCHTCKTDLPSCEAKVKALSKELVLEQFDDVTEVNIDPSWAVES